MWWAVELWLIWKAVPVDAKRVDLVQAPRALGDFPPNNITSTFSVYLRELVTDFATHRNSRCPKVGHRFWGCLGISSMDISLDLYGTALPIGPPVPSGKTIVFGDIWGYLDGYLPGFLRYYAAHRTSHVLREWRRSWGYSGMPR